MVKFVIIRHGYSLGNKEKRFTGQLDVPLDEVGYAQANATAKYVVENFKIDKIYSSDLRRAYDTAKPIAEALGLPINVEKSLREADVGIWEGRLISEVEKEFPERFAFYKTSPGLSHFEGGESYASLSARACATFERSAAENDGKTIAVTTHGGVIRTLFAAWNGISLEQIGGLLHFPNASVTVAEYDCGKVKFLQEGYDGHLAVRTVWAGDN